MAVESRVHDAVHDEVSMGNFELCSLDFDLSSGQWTTDYNTFDDYSSRHQSFSQSFSGVTSDSLSPVPHEILPSSSSQYQGTSFLSNFPSSRSSSVYNSLSFQSFSEGSFETPLSTYYADGFQQEVAQPEPESLDQRSSASWDLSSETGEQSQALFCQSPDLELVNPDNEWESVGGTDLLCKLVPECSKELLNLFKLPGQAKRRRYLTVRDMLNIKDKLSRVRTIFKNDTFANCLSPTPSLCTADSVVASEELFSVDENETPNSSVLSPPEDLSSIEAFINSTVEPSDASSVAKKPRVDRALRKHSLARLLPDNDVALPAASLTESVDSNPCDSLYRGSFSADDNYKRPRHFDFTTLEIGGFRVAFNPLEANQLCRLKVISASQKLVYEYEIPPRIAPTNPSLVLVTRVISIEVPFSSITAAGCFDNALLLIVNTRPFTFTGYRSSFPGQSRCCIYDTGVSNEMAHGELERCPLHRITFLKAETASRLKYHLLGCHSNFYKLFQSPFPNMYFDGLSPNGELFTAANPKEMESEDSEIVTGRSSLATAPFAEAPILEKAPPTSFCSCKVSCRSKRCSCSRQGKLCQNCRCLGCENPLNLLRDYGVNVTWAQSAPCLMNNIYLLNPKNLASKLCQKLTCPSCGYTEQVLSLLKSADSSCCPECLVRLGYSWCKDQLFLISQNQLRHCDTCRRCVETSGGAVECPRCLIPFSPVSGPEKFRTC